MAAPVRRTQGARTYVVQGQPWRPPFALVPCVVGERIICGGERADDIDSQMILD